MTAAILDHLWQSTFVTLVAGILAFVLANNGPQIRYWLWFVASLKFLIPFTVLAGFGRVVARLVPGANVRSHLSILRPAAEPFGVHAQAFTLSTTTSTNPEAYFLLIWIVGAVILISCHLLRRSNLRKLLDGSREISLPAPIPIRASSSRFEPGLVGILKPAILIPRDLIPELSNVEIHSILAHELSHFRRRDNLTAAIHMIVEVLFWFYPPVWMIGARLLCEREQACDESVLASGHDALIYANTILKVCKFCLHTPIACGSGATGADLRLRVALIISNGRTQPLGFMKALLLGLAATMILALPIGMGIDHSPFTKALHERVVFVRTRYENAISRTASAINLSDLPIDTSSVLGEVVKTQGHWKRRFAPVKQMVRAVPIETALDLSTVSVGASGLPPGGPATPTGSK